ncbi:hypothetical protein BDN70DRAFT_821646, partial [Pholiota conissans]
LVPKFHLAAHIEKCQTEFSFNYVPGVGRTDGESPERGWSDINAIAMSTREMGPGSRRDTLDDHFGDRNWRKIATLSSTFVRKAKEALAGREEHVAAFLEFDAALPAASTQKWTKLCQAWEKDRKNAPNPFTVPKLHMSNKEVRLRLAQEDAEALAAGKTIMVQEDMSPSVLIYQGLEIEDLQRKLAFDTHALGTHSTDLQRAKILERSNFIRRKFEAWKDIQHLFVPGLALLRSRTDIEDEGVSIAAHNLKLYLPSSRPQDITYGRRLIEAEWLFRFAQAGTTLNDIRSHLMLRSRLYASKMKNSVGTSLQTRSMGLIHDVDAKIRFSAAKYRHHRTTMEALSALRKNKDASWRTLFKPLHEDDLVGLTFMDNLGSEGRRKLTWIWNVQVDGMDIDVDAASHAALRIEWSKARARAHRWQEECLLLAEEMRRILAYFQWRESWWIELSKDPPMILQGRQAQNSSTILEKILDAEHRVTIAGKQSYALRQADIQKQIRENCRGAWIGLDTKLLSMDGGDARVMIESCSVD